MDFIFPFYYDKPVSVLRKTIKLGLDIFNSQANFLTNYTLVSNAFKKF